MQVTPTYSFVVGWKAGVPTRALGIFLCCDKCFKEIGPSQIYRLAC